MSCIMKLANSSLIEFSCSPAQFVRLFSFTKSSLKEPIKENPKVSYKKDILQKTPLGIYSFTC